MFKLNKNFDYLKNRLKDNFILWIGLILCIVLTVSIFIILRSETTQKLVLNENDIPTKSLEVKNSVVYYEPDENDKFELPNSTNQEIVNILAKTYSIFIENDKDSSIKGIIGINPSVVCNTENGQEMCDSASPSVRWLIRAMDVKKNQNATFNSVEIEEIKKNKIKILSLIKEDFVKNGFIKEKVISDYPLDIFFQDSLKEYYEEYTLFGKKDIKCIVSSEILNEKYTAIEVKCSDQYRKIYQYKIELINNLGDELSEQFKTRTLGKVSLFDRYGIFDFIGRGQGYVVAGMMDANDNWHILWQGQNGDGLPCEIFDEYPIFKKNYPTKDCYYRKGERAGELVRWD